MPKRGSLIVTDRLYLAGRHHVWGQSQFSFRNKSDAPIEAVVLCFNRKPERMTWSPSEPEHTVLDAVDGYSIVIHSIPAKSTIMVFSYGESSQLVYVMKDKKILRVGVRRFLSLNPELGPGMFFGKGSI